MYDLARPHHNSRCDTDSPITSNVDKLYPSEAYVTFRGKKSKAMADQIAVVSKKRLINSAGSISKKDKRRTSNAQH